MPRFALLGAGVGGTGVGVGTGGVGGGVGVGVGVGVGAGGVGAGNDGAGVEPAPEANATLTPLPQPDNPTQAVRAKSASVPGFGGVQKLFKGLPSTCFVIKDRSINRRTASPALSFVAGYRRLRQDLKV
jgi:hypothetical protein